MAETTTLTNAALKAGLLDLFYENGSIRWIKLGNAEIVRMIYSAVRDCNWGTIEPVVLEQKAIVGDTTFEITLKVEYKAPPIHFIADYRIQGKDNNIRFEMKGTAQTDFLKNRIGFCILHPIRECAGKTARVIHSSGNLSEFTFPEYISPHQPVKNVQSIMWQPAPGITARLNMTGDIFEMEDQRNWTDASYKTYCTPLELPFPAMINKGETVAQMVELLIDAPVSEQFAKPEAVFSWNHDSLVKLPSIGTSISSRPETLTLQEIDLLKQLPLKHLRVEVKMTMPDFSRQLSKASRESKLLEIPLFIVLYLSNNYIDEYQEFIHVCQSLNMNIGWILPVGKNHLPLAGFNEIIPHLRDAFPGTLIGTGVNAYFAELNRARPSIENADFVSFTISPQVHAFDNASLVENLQAQEEVILSARKLFPHKAIFVSPISLKQRFNVVATTEDSDPEPGTLPSSVDARQRLPFAACWTLGSLRYLSQAGASLVTYYETVGWKGWIQGELAPAVPELFPTIANELFPVYSVLKKLEGYTHVAQSESSNLLLFDGLVVVSGSKTKLFLFNFTEEDLQIRLNPFFSPPKAKSPLYTGLSPLREGKINLKAGDCMEIIL